MVETKSKNLISIAIVVAGLLIAGALIYIDLGKDLREKGSAKVVQPENSSVQEEQQEEPQNQPADGSLADFAKCLGQKGLKLYGASWCSWCARQKELFGEAVQYLAYVECIDKETEQLTEECQKAEITGFPTWEFPGKGKEAGLKTLEELSELSGCPLPGK